jgi:hypothetical protein
MENGAYIVRENDKIPHDINFSIKPEVMQVPELQQKLQMSIEQTLMIIRKLFKGENEKSNLDNYFAQLLSLAQAGLVVVNAQPTIAMNALLQLRAEIVDLKSGEIKNNYFKTLGMQALWLTSIPIIIALSVKALYYYLEVPTINQLSVFSNYIYVWCGTMLGIWISFGARKTILTFEELTTIEEDRLEPLMRLLFIGSISMVFAVLFYKQAISIKIGTISSADIEHDSFVGIIFGVMLGLSEQVLGKKITKKAASLFDNI